MYPQPYPQDPHFDGRDEPLRARLLELRQGEGDHPGIGWEALLRDPASPDRPGEGSDLIGTMLSIDLNRNWFDWKLCDAVGEFGFIGDGTMSRATVRKS